VGRAGSSLCKLALPLLEPLHLVGVPSHHLSSAFRVWVVHALHCSWAREEPLLHIACVAACCGADPWLVSGLSPGHPCLACKMCLLLVGGCQDGGMRGQGLKTTMPNFLLLARVMSLLREGCAYGRWAALPAKARKPHASQERCSLGLGIPTQLAPAATVGTVAHRCRLPLPHLAATCCCCCCCGRNVVGKMPVKLLQAIPTQPPPAAAAGTAPRRRCGRGVRATRCRASSAGC
jgi:hypothetical protein